jgi:hypothetical protein
MDSSKLSFKLFIEEPTALDVRQFVPVFHSWIQTHAIPDHLLVDVADYSHVHNGPGVVLVSHEANYSLDTRGGRPGLTYQRKQSIPGTFSQRLSVALRATLHAAGLLRDRLTFRRDEVEFRLCDRLHAPNTPPTFEAVKPDLLKLWPGARLEHHASDLELFRLTIRPAHPISELE